MTIDPRLEADTLPVMDLDLCTVRLMNDARYPWLILVPKRAGVIEVLDLEPDDQDTLWQEIRACADALQRTTNADKLNIAALGNVVAQLHVHVIARFKTDDAWPKPVWGVHPPAAYASTDAERLVRKVRAALA